MPTLGERIQKAWNAFRNKDPTPKYNNYYSFSYGNGYVRPDRRRPRAGGERSIVMPILNRMAVDAAKVDIRHVRLDEFDRYKEDVKDWLNDLLTLEANSDQSAREFRQDVFASMLDEGYIAVVPIVADINDSTMMVNKVRSARVGKILAWYPKEIDVEVYNEETGKRENIRIAKSLCLILQNPFYEIMNAPNSLLVRLRKKLALLDQMDEKVASGKLDMFIQLPYSTRHETQKARAEERKKEIEVQLEGSRYGIAYIDSAEKVIPLGRSLENNLQGETDSLTKQLMDQLGVSPEILNSSGNEVIKLNYNDNIIEPIVSTFTDAIIRKWLTPTARTQGHSIMSFHNPFRVVPVGDIAELGDKLLRNQILTPNEMRGILGFKPSDAQGADDLRNPNMPLEEGEVSPEEGASEEELPESEAPEVAPTEEAPPATESPGDDATIQEVIDTMDDRQLDVLNYLVEQAERGQRRVLGQNQNGSSEE